MPEALKFHFPLAALLRDGDAIVTAAEAHTDLAPRLAANLVTGTRTLLGDVASGATTAKGRKGSVGTLTKEQNRLLGVVGKWMTKARKTASLAFPGQDVKLHQEFCLGVNTPADLASVLDRARTIIAGLRTAANFPAVKARGWLATDTDAFEAVVNSLASTDTTQETGKGGAKGATTQRNQQANLLYDNLLTLQNAAELQWPEDDPDNDAVRAEFRLDTFPPRGGNGGSETPPTEGGTTPPTTPPSA